MAQHHAAAVRHLDHATQTLHDLVTVDGGILILRHIKAEHTDALRTHDIRQLNGVPNLIEVRRHRIGDLDLAERRADRPDAQTVGVQLLFERFRLGGGELHEVLIPYRARLKVLDAVFEHRIDLYVNVVACLVGKSAENNIVCHDSHPFGLL